MTNGHTLQSVDMTSAHVAFYGAEGHVTLGANDRVVFFDMRFLVYPDVAVAPAKALMLGSPHASIHRD